MRNFLFLKNNGKGSQIFYNDLQYVEAVNKYVRFVTVKKTFFVLGSLQHVEKHLPLDQFCRISRSYIASFRHITDFTSEIIFIAGCELPLGKQYKELFLKGAEVLCADGGSIFHTSGNSVDRLLKDL
jgi:DNA-binding LytR/AlgR family response regulator